jgi:hypothetical protein
LGGIVRTDLIQQVTRHGVVIQAPGEITGLGFPSLVFLNTESPGDIVVDDLATYRWQLQAASQPFDKPVKADRVGLKQVASGINFAALIAIQKDPVNAHSANDTGNLDPTVWAGDVGQRWPKHQQPLTNELVTAIT